MFHVYILVSDLDGRLYIGQTNDITDRLVRHNTGRVKSTLPHKPWKLLYSYEFDSRSMAMKFEKYLKSLKNKKYILENLLYLKLKFELAEKSR
jgi:putative endonuclease